MRITLKLFAGLAKYLPRAAIRNEVGLEVESGTTLSALLENNGVPADECHLVLVNGIYIPPSERETHELLDSDTLAVWPPVAGG